jgi:hypothetical protein
MFPPGRLALIWPGFGVGWFGTGGNPNDDLAALGFSHQRLVHELSQIVRRARADTVMEPATGMPASAGEPS